MTAPKRHNPRRFACHERVKGQLVLVHVVSCLDCGVPGPNFHRMFRSAKRRDEAIQEMVHS